LEENAMRRSGRDDEFREFFQEKEFGGEKGYEALLQLGEVLRRA
jgi:hypothetical protein